MNTDYDIVICGYGPVGQTAANLFGMAGRRVLVLEQWGGLYHLPRAAHIDHEIMRILQLIGKANDIEDSLLTCDKYRWLNAEGRTLIEFDFNLVGKSGWVSDYLIYQPGFEAVLDAGVKRFDSVDVVHNAKVTGHRELDDHVVVEYLDTKTGLTKEANARFLVGCDGANSYVRQSAEIEYDDLGFNEDWLVVDMLITSSQLALPSNPEQHCDPSRPITVCPMPGNRYRWEFMRLPGETKQLMTEEDFVWQHLRRWGVTSDDAQIERSTVYTFNSKIAPTWRQGRILLAGDACHLTPPFLGQGMAMGMRDVVNLAWKLNLVLDGVASVDLLDAYGPERLPQVTGAINLAMELGAVVCAKDPEAVKARDAEMLAVRESGENPGGEDTITFPDLIDGVIQKNDAGERKAPAGDLFVQGWVSVAGQTDSLLESLVGGGFMLLANAFNPDEFMSDVQSKTWRKLSGKTVVLNADASDNSLSISEVEGSSVYVDWFAQNACSAVIMRPDFYVFGVASAPDDLGRLLDDLSNSLYLN